MPLTLEQYKELRASGKTPDQIAVIAKAPTGLRGIGSGIAKGVVSTAFGIGKIGTSVGRTLLPKIAEPPQNVFERPKPEILTPVGGFEKTGFALEQLAEFLVPSTKLAKLEKGKSLLFRAGAESATFGGITAVQEGGITEDAKTAAIVGALFPVAGAALKGVKQLTGAGTQAVGTKIQKSVLRATAADFRDGFKYENITKYGVGGSLKDIVAKTHVELNKLSNELAEKLKVTDATVNLQAVFAKTLNEIQKQPTSKFKQFGSSFAFRRAIDDLKKEVKVVTRKNPNIDLYEATLVKRGAGTKGSWAFGQPDRNAKALESVYNAFYRNLRKEIETSAGVAGGDIARLNKQIGDLIPISNAALRRLPVEQRNNAISLTESIGLFASMFDPRALSLVGANKLLRSGKFAGALIRAGQALKKEPLTRSAIGERALGGSFKNIGGPAPTNLTQEARKYKTAEEFVGAQTKSNSWSEAQKANPDLWNKGILRRSLSPVDAKGVIPKDVHTIQSKWQNYGQYDEIPADVVYKRIEGGSFKGEYEDALGNAVRDKNGNVLRDVYDDTTGEWIKPNISNQELRDALLKQFETPEGKKYLNEVIKALPKNPDGTVTAYRIGSMGEGTQSYTLSEGMAKTFSNQGTDIPLPGTPGLPKGGYKDFGVLPANMVKIDPKGIKAWSPYDAEILVEPKYVQTKSQLTDIWKKANALTRVRHNDNQ